MRIESMNEPELRHVLNSVRDAHRLVVPRAVQKLIADKQEARPPRGSEAVRLRAANRAMDCLAEADTAEQLGAVLMAAKATGEIEFADWAFRWFYGSLARREFGGEFPDGPYRVALMVLETARHELRAMVEQDHEVRRRLAELEGSDS